ncbi:MAG: hypothetical protein RL115_652 [Bacteroidota bacterium]|jgi:hypothetical protein
MKQWLIISASILTLSSCKSGNKEGETPKTDTTVKKDTVAIKSADTIPSVPPATVAEFPVHFKPTKTFLANKADLHESLRIQQIDKKKIAYEVMMENGDCPAFTFRGIAILKEGDAESDSDEKNNGYFVDEYVDDANGKCGVTVRIGIDAGYTDRARFYVYDCAVSCKTKQESEPLRLK